MTQNKAPIYRDPLGLDDPVVEPGPTTTVQRPLTITGLSDEEDAARHMELHFDTSVRFCTNCEFYVEVLTNAADALCPRCEMYLLWPAGTRPLHRKLR